VRQRNRAFSFAPGIGQISSLPQMR
jgi:hypothetical protein